MNNPSNSHRDPSPILADYAAVQNIRARIAEARASDPDDLLGIEIAARKRVAERFSAPVKNLLWMDKPTREKTFKQRAQARETAEKTEITAAFAAKFPEPDGANKAKRRLNQIKRAYQISPDFRY